MSEQRSGQRRGATPGLTPLQSGGGQTATPLRWHLISAGVIAMLATTFLAVLDARQGGAETSQATVRRAETTRDTIAATSRERVRMANAEAASPAPVAGNVAALPTGTPSPSPLSSGESRAAPPAVARPTAPVAAQPAPVAAPPTPPVATQPTFPAAQPASPAAAQPAPPVAEQRPPVPTVQTAAPPAAAPSPVAPSPPVKMAAVPVAPSEPAETSSIAAGIAHPSPPLRPERSGSVPGVIASAQTPTQCLSGELRDVLADVAERFGAVTLLSTTDLHTDNHSPGSARAKMHANCKAVDFKSGKNVKEVLAYLRTRKEVGGINSYRNGVIHIDANPAYRVAAQPTRTAPGTKPRRASQKKPSGRKRRR